MSHPQSAHASHAATPELAKTFTDVSIVAIIAVVAIIIIVVFSTYRIVRFLRSVVDGAGGRARTPPPGLAVWRGARQSGAKERLVPSPGP